MSAKPFDPRLSRARLALDYENAAGTLGSFRPIILNGGLRAARWGGLALRERRSDLDPENAPCRHRRTAPSRAPSPRAPASTARIAGGLLRPDRAARSPLPTARCASNAPTWNAATPSRAGCRSPIRSRGAPVPIRRSTCRSRLRGGERPKLQSCRNELVSVDESHGAAASSLVASSSQRCYRS